MTTTTTTHGTYTHGTPELTGSGRWIRVDQYTSHDGGLIAADLFHCTGPDDDTAPHIIMSVAECSWCWLGYGHTDAEHARHLDA